VCVTTRNNPQHQGIITEAAWVLIVSRETKNCTLVGGGDTKKASTFGQNLKPPNCLHPVRYDVSMIQLDLQWMGDLGCDLIGAVFLLLGLVGLEGMH